MIQTTIPQVKLSGIEYLLLSIQANPGKSQRWHLKRKYMYQHGRPDFHKGGSGSGYFNSRSYRNVLWRDLAPKDTFYECSLPIEAAYISPGKYGGMRSKSAQMHLTMSGWTRANEARIKLGLAPIKASFKDCSTM